MQCPTFFFFFRYFIYLVRNVNAFQEVIDDALRGRPPGEVLVEKFSIQITRKDIATLCGLNWLNDEVMVFRILAFVFVFIIFHLFFILSIIFFSTLIILVLV